MERGVVQLEAVRDGLYRQIRQVRGDPPPVLALPSAMEPVRRKRLLLISAPWAAAVCLLCLLAMYSGFAWVLATERTKVLQPFQLSAPDLTRTPL